MAVIYAENNGPSLLSTLSGLATLAGTFIPGAQVLTPIGMGMGAIDAAQQGNYTEMNNAIKGIRTGDWKNNNKNQKTNSANKKANLVMPTAQQQEDAYLAKTWGPAYYGTYGTYGGVSPWQL